MISFKQFIVQESINDQGIFKAIFVIGIPGAGKSYTVSKLGGDIAPRVVNTDKAAEFLSKKLSKNVSRETWAEYFKDSSHRITLESLSQYLNSMLPLFIDGTSNDVSNILHRAGILESLGYDVGLLFIDTPLDVAITRANERAAKTGRIVDSDFITQVHALAEENKNFLKNKFSFYAELKNDSHGIDDETLLKAYKKTRKFYLDPVSSPVGRRHLEVLFAEKQKYLVPTIMPTAQLRKKVDGWYKS